MPTERPPLLGEVVPTSADRGYCVVSATDPPCRILGFLDRSRYYFSQVAPQLYSRVLTRLSGPRSRPTASQKIWKRRESNPGPLTTRPQRRSVTRASLFNVREAVPSLRGVNVGWIPEAVWIRGEDESSWPCRISNPVDLARSKLIRIVT
jgi:hypothetical protein